MTDVKVQGSREKSRWGREKNWRRGRKKLKSEKDKMIQDTDKDRAKYKEGCRER